MYCSLVDDVTLAGTTVIHIPLYSSTVPAGFPSPADDYVEDALDLNGYLVKRPSATFMVRAHGTSMIEAGIQDKALLIVDRSIKPRHGDIVIAALDGRFTCKRLDLRRRALCSTNPGAEPIVISEGDELQIFGVVVHVVNTLCSHS
ncbi:MAG TPA: translesion error-prone DNA polymerase V autoproteolytic subunit [Pseudomonadales bacterium]